jgi:hypothetical protein
VLDRLLATEAPSPIVLYNPDLRESADGKNLPRQRGRQTVRPDMFRCGERARRWRGRERRGLSDACLATTGNAVYTWKQLKTSEAFLNTTLKIHRHRQFVKAEL